MLIFHHVKLFQGQKSLIQYTLNAPGSQNILYIHSLEAEICISFPPHDSRYENLMKLLVCCFHGDRWTEGVSISLFISYICVVGEVTWGIQGNNEAPPKQTTPPNPTLLSPMSFTSLLFSALHQVSRVSGRSIRTVWQQNRALGGQVHTDNLKVQTQESQFNHSNVFISLL